MEGCCFAVSEMLMVFLVTFDICGSAGPCGISLVLVILRKMPKMKLNFLMGSNRIIFNA